MASRIRPRDIGLIALGLAVGLTVAWLDSRPGWDDAGITTGLLVAGGAVVAVIDGRRPWLWTALVGGPLPVVEVPGSGSAAPFVALLFAAIGVTIGILIRRAVPAGASTT
ncbi:MAG TPA: hypothetical protein VJ506_08285 [Candidatus Limnocylindrales bacterium]|nr:hypothetical protein [Candidatus Limnocylindrales bacterium]